MPKKKSSLAEGFRSFHGLEPGSAEGTRQVLTDIWQGLPTAAGMAYAKLRGGELGVGPADTLIARMPWEETHPSQTIGKLIMVPEGMDLSEPMDKGIFEHEAGHVQQGDYFGPLTPLAAIAGGVSQWVQGKDFYEDNPFERQAPRMGKERIEKMEGRKSSGKPKKSYQEGTMAMRSKAEFEPGMAQAYQSPYAVGPVGGMGSGNMFGYMQSLMERQMRLKEAMAKAQLAQMKEERKAAQQRLEAARKQSLRNSTMFRKGLAPQMIGKDPRQASRYTNEVAPRKLAHALTQGGTFGAFGMAPTQEAIEAIGMPAAIQGLQQSGRILGGLGQTALGGGYNLASNRARNQGDLALQKQQQQFLLQNPGLIQGRTAEKGGRVPKTGTYKLHKDEIVLNKDQSDAMFPQAPKPAKGKAKGSYQDGTFGDEATFADWGFLAPIANLLSGRYNIPEEDPERYAMGVQAPWLPPEMGEIEAIPGPLAGGAPTPSADMTTGYTEPAPTPPPLGIEGLEIEEGVPISERRMVDFMGQQVPSRQETDQKTVKQYTLTSPPETDEEKRSRHEATAAKFGRDAEYYQQKADAILQYAGENPSSDVMRMYQERQAIADRYQKRADKEQQAYDKLDQQMRGAKTAKELEEIEQGGLTQRQGIKSFAEMDKSIEQARQGAMDGIQNAMKMFNEGKYDDPEAGFVTDVMASLDARVLSEIAERTGMSPEDARDTIYDLAKAEATGSTQDGTPISPGQAIAIIQMLISGGNALGQ